MRPAPWAAAVAALAVGLALASPIAADAASSAPRVPASVAVVVPLAVQISDGSFAPADLLASETAPAGRLTRELDAVIDSPVTLAIDPMLIASIRVLGSAAPASAVAWLARLQSARNPSFALAYADADLTAPLQAGARRVPALGSLAFGVDPTNFGAVAAPQPGATATPGTVPTTDELTAFDYTETGVAWPRADSVTAATLDAITRDGYSTTLLASKNVKRTTSSSASATISGTPVVVSDEVVSGLADRALDAVGDEEWAAASDALGAAVTAYRDDATAVITFDRTSEFDPSLLADVIGVIASAAHTQIVPLQAVADAPAASARMIDQPQSSDRIRLVRQLLNSELQARRFATVAEDPTLISGERRARLLVSLSPGADASTGGLSTVAQTYTTETDALLGAVHVEQGSTITLLADRASIYVSVTNDLDQAATVLVSVRPLAPLIKVEDSEVSVTVKAHSQRKASIPVQSLSNGTVTLVVTLTTPTGVRIGDPTTVSTSVRAGWETPVTFALAGALALVFAVGLWRSLVLRRRRRSRDAPPAPAEPADEG